MKKIGIALLVAVVAFSVIFAISTDVFSQRKKFERFGEDERGKEWKGKKWETSTKTFTWRMSDPWGGLVFHEITKRFADSVRAASGGRLDIKVFPTGSIVPALEIFDATAKGTIDACHTWPGYWKGKNEAFVAFASVPFGLDAEGYNIWFYERGGLQMLQELYGRYGLIAFPCGNVGQEIALHSRKKVSKLDEIKGIKMRTVGWYMDILTAMGISVTPLPGGEIYLALERGIIDAAEFSTPAANYPQGFHEIAKYLIMPGVHQPSCQFDVVINKKKWDELPDDLKVIVELAARDTDMWANAWNENLNIEGVKRMKRDGAEFVKMDDKAIIEFAKASRKYLEELCAKHPDVKKVLTSQWEFMKDFEEWRDLRGRVTPWPYETFIKGKLTQ